MMTARRPFSSKLLSKLSLTTAASLLTTVYTKGFGSLAVLLWLANPQAPYEVSPVAAHSTDFICACAKGQG